MLVSRFVKAFIIQCFAHIASTTIICGTFKCLFIQRIWNPFTLFSHMFSQLFHPMEFFSMTILFVMISLLSRIHVKSFSVHWWLPEKRLDYVSQFFKPSILPYSFLHMAIFPCLLYYYVVSSYPNVPHLLHRCFDGHRICVNPTVLLVILCGIVFGFRFFINYFFNNFNVVRFSSGNPSLGTFFKSKLKFSVILDCIFSYGIGLEFLGCTLVTYIISGCFLNQIEKLHMVHSSYIECVWWILVRALSDPSMLLTLGMSLGLLAFNLHISFCIFDHFVTQRLEAPLPSSDVMVPRSASDKAETNFNLSNCLSSDSKLMQYLAFCHLKDIAIDSSHAGQVLRGQMFAISQPGGHPHNWQSILKPSLNLIRKFTERLKKNNSLDDRDSKLNGHNLPSLQTQSIAPQEGQLLTIRQKLGNKLKELPLFSYLLQEIPEASNRKIFAEAQPVIWAVHGISHLVASSFHDDTYGVVQKNISDILSSLVDLQQVVDKVGRGGTLRRSNTNSIFPFSHRQPQDVQLRRSLRMTIRSSIYAIAITFKESLREIPVSEEVASRLDSYLTFQEG